MGVYWSCVGVINRGAKYTMSWNHYAIHECGHFEDVPFGNSGFLTSFGKLCTKCGKGWNDSVEVFVAREVFDGKWWNPLTWFQNKLVRRDA